MQEPPAVVRGSAQLLAKDVARLAVRRPAMLPAPGATARPALQSLAQASHLGRSCVASRSRPHLRGSLPHSAARKFFLAAEQPLEAAAMNGQSKGALQVRQQIAGAQIGALAPPLLDMRQNLRRELVPVLRPPPLGQQTGKPERFEG